MLEIMEMNKVVLDNNNIFQFTTTISHSLESLVQAKKQHIVIISMEVRVYTVHNAKILCKSQFLAFSRPLGCF